MPIFQREYVWSERQFVRMLNELDSIVDGEDVNRFLGAIIGVRRNSNPASPQVFEIVDGQQRLTTLYLLVTSAAYIASRNGHEDYAKGLINTNLILTWWTPVSTNTKLIPSYSDRAQFNKIIRVLINSGRLGDSLGVQTILLDSQGSETGRLKRQFDKITKVLQNRYDEFGLEHIKELITAATTKLTFVFILLRDPSNATTVFKGLNDPGIPIGIGDLVRNEVFSSIATDSNQALSIHRDHWIPFREKFGEFFDNYFFPFAIIHKSSIKNAELFHGLVEIWSSSNGNPIEIIKILNEFQLNI
ncbi:MAG: DUF262 domain-containing protein [Chloroflexia bacterium]|nr:DUF262 domain-containing protein [Chloroflexia bacterium]